MKTQNIRAMTMTAVCAAQLAVLSQISIPMPSGMPITLQTLGVAVCGCMLSWRYTLMCIGCYLMLGAVGLPVFSGFSAGLAKLTGVTGGFLWGFLVLGVMCSLGSRARRRLMGYALCGAGLLICHVMGSLQFALVNGTPFVAAALVASVPYLLKDALSIAAALVLSRKIVRTLSLGRGFHA